MKSINHYHQKSEIRRTDCRCILRTAKKITVILLIVLFALMLAGCNSFISDLFKGNETQLSQESNQGENNSGTSNEEASAGSETGTGESDATAETGPEEDLKTTDESTDSLETGAALQTSNKDTGIEDIEMQREYFKKGVGYLEDKNYILAEYYFNKILLTYEILSDHIIYYFAKSLLMQEKFDMAEENYARLKQDYPDSIFYEIANLEYADLFFIKQNYRFAEIGYESFIRDFPESELAIYGRYQLAVCKQRNEKFLEAFENYKNIWLEHPESDYAEQSYQAIKYLEEENHIEEFIPSNSEIYQRGELFFGLYLYEKALEEFNKLLEYSIEGKLEAGLHSKTLFRTGMSYYNMRNYSKAAEYLSSCYSKFPSGNYADDSIYFLGRAYTNLDQESKAVEKYNELLTKFSYSNYADDALYRMGRIYFLDGDLENAEKYYQSILDKYPGGDRVTEIYWELGWIQYMNGDYSSAKNTFSGMSDRFGNSSLGEKGLFWNAKCCEKTGQKEEAIENYRRILAFDSFSYYTFASKSALEKLGEKVELKKIDTSVYPDNPEIGKLLPDVFNEGEAIQDKGFSHIDRARELLIIEFYDSADREIEAASDEVADDSSGILEISTLYLKAKDYIKSQKIISKNYKDLQTSLSSPYEDYLYFLLYPYGYREYVEKYSDIYGVDPLYVMALIREESRFNPDAGSYAGALGLMQIMPSTGGSIAASIGISGFGKEMLFDPETNIMMGIYYISAQLDKFEGNKYYAAGAYNGGPGAMSRWLSRYTGRDIDEFIENIPYDETRNYIKKVMGSYYFYQILYSSL